MTSIPVEEEKNLAFMLRLRQEASTRPWQAILANPQTGQQHSFADLEILYRFLDERLAQLDGVDGDEAGRRPKNPSANRM
jgi:hypothetical protein